MKFHSKPIEEHDEVPLADEGRWEALVEHWAERRARPPQRPDGRNACYVVSVSVGPRPLHPEAALGEILALVRAREDDVVGHELLHRARPDPRTFLGRGAAEAVAARATEAGADMLVLDAELSPSQTRNLEDATGLPICDREGVILEVFERHAKTRKARIQVEIAHLEYLRPRIRGLGLDMDQQAGGLVKARGPGETASELLARRLDGRLAELRKAFARLERAGQTQRKARHECRRVALVGYTNAGKSTLLNSVTGSDVDAENKLFATLDPTVRRIRFPMDREIVLLDTVGFIRELPPALRQAFSATLEEIADADLLLHVVDATDPDRDQQVATVDAVLAELGAGRIPRFVVLNKCDMLEEHEHPAAEEIASLTGGDRAFFVSALDKRTTRELMVALESHLWARGRVERPEHAQLAEWEPASAEEPGDEDEQEPEAQAEHADGGEGDSTQDPGGAASRTEPGDALHEGDERGEDEKVPHGR
ncbi:MAG: GTPase HflX [Myxococcales bacterium]|nr:GTPase HflX [Myxococcales bacterium]